MKQLPILFSTDMVQAILAGRKTQTRRVVAASNTHGFSIPKKELDFDHIHNNGKLGVHVGAKEDPELLWRGRCKWQTNDVLYVRETFVYRSKHDRYYYKADHPEFEPYAHDGWKPSIHMPKSAARIWLKVKAVKVERLRDISDRDCIDEGILPAPGKNTDDVYKNYMPDHPAKWCGPLPSFGTLWCSINGTESWQANPWVWVVEFEVVSTTGKPNFFPT